MSDPEILDAATFRRELLRVYETTPQHVIGQTRTGAEQALASGQISDGWSVTFHDDQDDDAYCLAVVDEGELVVRFKTHGTMPRDGDS